LERAIECYTNALQVLTQDAFPLRWVGIQMNLGDAYSKRIHGKRTENLEHAIECYKAALRVCTEADLPVDHHVILSKLAEVEARREHA